MHFIYNVCIMYVCMVVSSVAAHKSPSQVDCCFRFIEFVHSLIIYFFFFWFWEALKEQLRALNYPDGEDLLL